MSSKILEYWANIFKSINISCTIIQFVEDIRNLKHDPHIQNASLRSFLPSIIPQLTNDVEKVHFLFRFIHFHNALPKPTSFLNFTWIKIGNHLSYQVILNYRSTISYSNPWGQMSCGIQPQFLKNFYFIFYFWRVKPCLYHTLHDTHSLVWGHLNNQTN